MTPQKLSILEQRKIQIISMLTNLYDEEILDEIENILLESKKDWWDEISEEARLAIDEGLEDIKRGNLISHGEVLKEINQKLK